MKKIVDYIKDKDDYGHPVLVSFDHDGPTHNTFFTGIWSLLARGVMFWYAFKLISRYGHI